VVNVALLERLDSLRPFASRQSPPKQHLAKGGTWGNPSRITPGERLAENASHQAQSTVNVIRVTVLCEPVRSVLLCYQRRRGIHIVLSLAVNKCAGRRRSCSRGAARAGSDSFVQPGVELRPRASIGSTPTAASSPRSLCRGELDSPQPGLVDPWRSLWHVPGKEKE
jgi:hypothetical protein